MLVCDDCGEEKVDKETGKIYRVKIPPLEPSFILQTSLQSTQWIYVLKEPLECADHGDLIKRCWGAIADAGYSQNIGELSRYVRVPGSRGYKFNDDGSPKEGKHGYVCRCVHAA